jgi:predicted transcriptional regulator
MKKRSSEQALSRRERQILDALYRLGRASAADIREEIQNPPTYTAVRTHLGNLEEKGMVTFQSDGTRYIYEPTVPRQQMARDVINDVLHTFFENRIELVVATLIDRKDSEVSQEELARLAEIIEVARRNGL